MQNIDKKTCDISLMPHIIEEYKAMSTYYLQQLMKEIEIYRISSEERSVLMDFLEYLNYHKIEAFVYVLERANLLDRFSYEYKY